MENNKVGLSGVRLTRKEHRMLKNLSEELRKEREILAPSKSEAAVWCIQLILKMWKEKVLNIRQELWKQNN